MNIGALGNANPLGVISQAMSGVGDMVKSAGSFIGNLAQMPPNLLGAIQDLCNVGNSVTQAMQALVGARV